MRRKLGRIGIKEPPKVEPTPPPTRLTEHFIGRMSAEERERTLTEIRAAPMSDADRDQLIAAFNNPSYRRDIVLHGASVNPSPSERLEDVIARGQVRFEPEQFHPSLWQRLRGQNFKGVLFADLPWWERCYRSYISRKYGQYPRPKK